MVRELPVDVRTEPGETAFELTVEVPEELAREAFQRTESEEGAGQYVLDHSVLQMEWGDIGRGE